MDLTVALICTPEERDFLKHVQEGEWVLKEIFDSEEMVFHLTFQTVFKKFEIDVIDYGYFKRNEKQHPNNTLFSRFNGIIVTPSYENIISRDRLLKIASCTQKRSNIDDIKQDLWDKPNKKNYFIYYFHDLISKLYGREKNLIFTENKYEITKSSPIPNNIFDGVNENNPNKKYVVSVPGGLIEISCKFHKDGEIIEV